MLQKILTHATMRRSSTVCRASRAFSSRLDQLDQTRVPRRTATWEWARAPTDDLKRKGGGMAALAEREPQIVDTIHYWKTHVKQERQQSVSQQLGAAVEVPARPQGALVRSSFVDITGAPTAAVNGRYYRELTQEPVQHIARFWKVEMESAVAKGQWYLLSQVDDRQCIDDCAGRSLGDWFVLELSPDRPPEEATVLFSCSWEEWASPCWKKPVRPGQPGVQARWQTLDHKAPILHAIDPKAGTFAYQRFFE